jgi:hypothetical protein
VAAAATALRVRGRGLVYARLEIFPSTLLTPSARRPRCDTICLPYRDGRSVGIVPVLTSSGVVSLLGTMPRTFRLWADGELAEAAVALRGAADGFVDLLEREDVVLQRT